MGRKGLSWWEPLAIVGLIALLGSLVAPTPGATGRSWLGAWYFARQDARDCRNNLKNIGTATEMYSTDNRGLFERRLDVLTPDYLRQVPTCPAAGTDTYSSGYMTVSDPDWYTVVCGGWHHRAAGMPPDFPQYEATESLIER